MKIVRFAVVCASLLLGAGNAGAVGAGPGEQPRLTPAQCQIAFSQSQAYAQGCRAPSGFGFANGTCYFGANCPRPDGSMQWNQEGTGLQNMQLWKNCGGRLAFICD